MKCKDGRIKLMNELLNGIKVCTCFFVMLWNFVYQKHRLWVRANGCHFPTRLLNWIAESLEGTALISSVSMLELI